MKNSVVEDECKLELEIHSSDSASPGKVTTKAKSQIQAVF